MMLAEKFFERPTLIVARELLGKFLVRRWRGKIVKAMIIEVEAYDGFKDKASHASRGLTKRNSVMFGPAGYWYVYFTYGMHWMLNIVTGKVGYPAAILIRGVEGISGPGRVTKFFKIGKSFNNKRADRKTGLWIEDDGVKIPPNKIKKGPRIGVDYAGPYWAEKEYRFFLSR
jgi:DNA-3-methyladenine glycosylase